MLLPSLCYAMRKKHKRTQKGGRAQKIRYENPKTAHATKRQLDWDPVAHTRHFIEASSISLVAFHEVQELEARIRKPGSEPV